jgi:D-glycero-alpha-D-manno-heptose 1-phosphate guanylyltransferase
MEDDRDARETAIHAFILCGGFGTRLRSVLDDRPKSMALISGIPFLQLLIEKLKSQKVGEVILGTGYMAEKIESYFRSGNNLGIPIRYSREDEPLGTGGALKLAEEHLSDPVLVLNGDSYATWDLPSMLDLFTAKAAAMVIAIQAVKDVARYGNVVVDHEGRVTKFMEKGDCGGPGLINAGVYLLQKQVVNDLPQRTAISLEKDVFPRLLSDRVYGLVCKGPFVDIGIPEELHRAQTLLTSKAF